MAIVSQGNSVVVNVGADEGLWIKSTGNAEVIVNQVYAGTPDSFNVTTDVLRVGFYGEPVTVSIRAVSGQAEYQNSQFSIQPITPDSSMLDVSLSVDGIIEVMPTTKSAKFSPELLAEWDKIGYVIGAGSPVVTQDVSPTGKPCLKIVCSAYSEIQITNFVGREYNGNVYVAGYGTRSTTGVGGIEMRLYQGAGTSNYKRGRRLQSSSAAPLNSYIEQGGDIVMHFNKENTTNVGTVSDSFVMTQARLTIDPHTAPCTFYLYAVGLDAPRKSRLCIVADDGWESAATVGAAIFNKRKIPMTISVIAERVGKTNYATLNQLKSFVGAGNSCVTHGPIPVGGNLISNYPNASLAVKDMIFNRQYLADNDLLKDGGGACYVWPQGQFQWSTADLSLLNAAINNGFTHARTATEMGVNDLGYSQNYDCMSKYQRMAVPIVGHTWAGTTAAEVTNIANIVTKIQRIAAAGLDTHLMLHEFVPDSTPDGSMNGQRIRVSDAATIADAIKAEVDAGRMEVVLMDDLAFKKGNYWSQLG